MSRRALTIAILCCAGAVAPAAHADRRVEVDSGNSTIRFNDAFVDKLQTSCGTEVTAVAPATLVPPGAFSFPIAPGGAVSEETLYGDIPHNGGVHLDVPPDGPTNDAELQQPIVALNASRPVVTVAAGGLRAALADVDLSTATVNRSFDQAGGSFSITGATLRLSSEAASVLSLYGCSAFSAGEVIGTGDTQGQGHIDPTPPPGPQGRCAGRTATITGTGGRDRLTGTSGADVIDARGGNDRIRGLSGADLVCGGAGRDDIGGGAGADRLFGQAGRDKVSGNAGKDLVDGGGGNDRLSGGAGNDRLKGGAGKDRLAGGAGRDRLLGGPGPDGLLGGSGRDALVGGPGRDRSRQ